MPEIENVAIPPATAPQVPEASVAPAYGQPIPASPNPVPPTVLDPRKPALLQNPQAQQPAQPQQPQDALVQALQAFLQLQQGATPSQPATEAVKPATQVSEPIEDAIPVQEIKDPVVQGMVQVLQTFGDIDVSRVITKAIQYNDPALIDTAYLKSVAGDKAEQAEKIARTLVQTISNKAAEVEQQVFALAGGEAQWDAAVTAFNQTAPRELKLAVAQMLNTIDPEMVQAGAKLIVQFSQLSGAVPQQGTPYAPAMPVTQAQNALTKEQFKQEVAKLNPNDPNYAQLYQELYNRRALGKRLGM